MLKPINGAGLPLGFALFVLSVLTGSGPAVFFGIITAVIALTQILLNILLAETQLSDDDRGCFNSGLLYGFGAAAGAMGLSGIFAQLTQVLGLVIATNTAQSCK